MPKITVKNVLGNPPLQHIALIPDGNRRWAKAHNLPALMGHRRVVEKVFPELVKKALALRIPYLTIWGFSTENWHRSEEEVDGLFQLFDLFFNQYGQDLHQQGVRIVCLGREDNLSEKFRTIINKWEEITKDNQKLQLNIAFNYGGQDEIVRAVNKIIADPTVKKVTPDSFSLYLDTAPTHIPAPDLIIRTSGEQRLSGFLSWQSAYSELYFSDKPMPDWTAADLELAIADYQRRQRRYGK